MPEQTTLDLQLCQIANLSMAIHCLQLTNNLPGMELEGLNDEIATMKLRLETLIRNSESFAEAFEIAHALLPDLRVL